MRNKRAFETPAFEPELPSFPWYGYGDITRWYEADGVVSESAPSSKYECTQYRFQVPLRSESARLRSLVTADHHQAKGLWLAAR